MEKLAKLPLLEKDTVRFKCGDLWRGVNIEAIAGVTYSSYGEGEKPTFYGSKQNYAQASEWQSSGYLNIWVSTDPLGNIGSLSFNNDSEMAVIREYCDKFRIETKSALFRKAIMEKVLKELDENLPTLF